jgi:1D-myo-inositol-triphosphate 3-kinase
MNESSVLKALSTDSLSPFVPEYIQTVTRDGQLFVEMSDLLREFTDPAVMDIKMGVRTYLEEELEKARTNKILRQDMYKKMIDIDPGEPTPEEHALQAITKPRYMQWRETISSSSSLGFRIEGIKTSEGNSLKDFKTTRLEEDVKLALRDFISENPCVKEPFLRRLCDVRSALEQSDFFRRHEVIGSSLLFVYDSTDLCSVHLIDFGKTIPLPGGATIDHRSLWKEGNHEDGYLWGLDNLIRLWREIQFEVYSSPAKHRVAYGRSHSAMAL